MTDAVLCVDIGTTSLKAGLITAEGEVVSVCKVKLSLLTDRYHIAQNWLPAFYRAVKKLATSLGSASCQKLRILALSLSGNGPTVVTEQGTTILWNEPELKEKPVFNGPSLFLSKLLVLKKMYEADIAASRYIFSGPEYLIWQLTGKAVTILPEERFKPAYWDEELLEKAGIPAEKLASFYKPGQKYGELKSSILEEAGFIAQSPLPVFGAGPDFVAALIGTATLSPGRLCDRSGSSEGLNLCVPDPLRSPHVRTLPSVIPGLWNVSCLIPRSGRMSERHRITALQTALSTLRSLAQECGIDFPKKMLVTGGQTKNAAYMKRKAQALKITLVEANCDDAELLGDACVAWFGLGRFSSLQEAAGSIVKEGKAYEGV